MACTIAVDFESSIASGAPSDAWTSLLRITGPEALALDHRIRREAKDRTLPICGMRRRVPDRLEQALALSHLRGS